jgi:hypothetical protein
MDVNSVESNIKAQSEEHRSEKRRHEETLGDDKVPEPRSSKIPKGAGEQKRLRRHRGIDNESGFTLIPVSCSFVYASLDELEYSIGEWVKKLGGASC